MVVRAQHVDLPPCPLLEHRGHKGPDRLEYKGVLMINMTPSDSG